MTFISTIIAAGGKGERFNDPKGKQLYPIAGKPILIRTVEAFEKIASEIIIVVDEDIIDKCKKLFKTHKVVLGGKERSVSIRNGLNELSEKSEIVLIHDGARPLVSIDIINNVIETSKREGSAVPAVLVKDTIKLSKDKFVEKTLDRRYLWAIQTPQGFKAEIIKKAYEQDIEGATDDAMLVEKLGLKVKIVEGDYGNIKITTPQDAAIAEKLLKTKK